MYLHIDTGDVWTEEEIRVEFSEDYNPSDYSMWLHAQQETIEGLAGGEFVKINDTWRTADGRTLKITEMEAGHLKSTINWLKRNNDKVFIKFGGGYCPDSYWFDYDCIDYSNLRELMEKVLEKKRCLN